MKKITDDYEAKIRMWAANPQYIEHPDLGPLPWFPKQTLRSYEEMNRWKDQYILEIARFIHANR